MGYGYSLTSNTTEMAATPNFAFSKLELLYPRVLRVPREIRASTDPVRAHDLGDRHSGSPSFKTATICDSVNLDLFIRCVQHGEALPGWNAEKAMRGGLHAGRSSTFAHAISVPSSGRAGSPADIRPI